MFIHSTEGEFVEIRECDTVIITVTVSVYFDKSDAFLKCDMINKLNHF